MLQRLFHSVAVLAAIVIAYQGYAWAVVPWIEPTLAVKKPQPIDAPIFRGDPAASINKYQRILAAYFPRDHWSQLQPPIVVENPTGSAMFVLDGWERHDDGRVDLTHFAFLIFPTPRQGTAAPRDAIVLEAPQGAQLKFDKNFLPERGQFGEIDHGIFPGKITIRSDMREPGPADDLLIETSDLQMTSKLLRTYSEVRFQLGPNSGGGREMEIRLLEEETSKSKAGLKISSVDSLEIFQDVRLRLHLNSGSLLPGEKPVAKDKPASQKPASTSPFGDASNPPVEVTCDGTFHFDFLKYVAGFDRNVQVWQINPEGPSDQLSCDKLDICFAPKEHAKTPSAQTELDAASRQRADARWLEPDRIIAQGYPVIVDSPSRGAQVRGGRVQLMLRQRRVAIDGGQDVAITYGLNVLRAPQIHYQHPPAEAGTEIGTFRASGPGTLHYVPDPKQPEKVFQAEWQASVELGRHNGQPVLTAIGRPRLAVTAMGMLLADQIRLYLRELEVDGKMQPVPDRMNAVGQVEIYSPELEARTRELSAVFRMEATNAAVAGAGGGDANPQGLAKFNFADRTGGPAARTYQVQSDDMQLEVALRGKRAAPTTLSCNGNVAFREMEHAQLNGEEPLEVRGSQLMAEHLDTDALVTIRGAANGAVDPANPTMSDPLAEIRARGMTMLAGEVKLDSGQNRLWIDGPGIANMIMKRDLSGRENAAPTPIELRWQGGMNFDGRTVLIRQNVRADGPDDHLQCDEIAVHLTSKIEFGKNVDQKAIDVAEVECRGHVKMDHKSHDEMAQTSHERMELTRLSVNQGTGAISGSGPGVIRSTHFADQLASMTGPGAAAAKATEPTASGAKLHYLRVDFQHGLTGNIILREMMFQGRVRTIYGPVDAWEQELDPNLPDLLPPETLTLTSEELRINENPLWASRRPQEIKAASGSPIGPVQLMAGGNVRIEGESPKRGSFAAVAERASYDQEKELFILEGAGRVLASIRHRDPASGQDVTTDARKILYNRTTGMPEFDGVRSTEFVPGVTAPAGGGAPAPSAIFPFENASGPTPVRQ